MTLTIRRVEPNDYPGLQKIFTGPRAVWGTLQLPYPSVEMWHKRVMEQGEGDFNLVACVDNEIVGQIGLHTFPMRFRKRHIGQIGMAVRDDWQGRGVGTALMQAALDLADRWLNLTRLELEVFTDNEPALRLYQKFGFVLEGTQRMAAFRDGVFVDTHSMARLRK